MVTEVSKDTPPLLSLNTTWVWPGFVAIATNNVQASDGSDKRSKSDHMTSCDLNDTPTNIIIMFNIKHWRIAGCYGDGSLTAIRK